MKIVVTLCIVSAIAIPVFGITLRFPVEHSLLLSVLALLLAIALGILRVGDLLEDRFRQ